VVSAARRQVACLLVRESSSNAHTGIGACIDRGVAGQDGATQLHRGRSGQQHMRRGGTDPKKVLEE
jgi:hypothetical protein